MAFFPGCKINVEENATMSVGNEKNVYVYDLDQWGAYCWNNANVTYAKLSTVPVTRGNRTLSDAEIEVNGTFDTSKGCLYTTSSGANIYTTGSGVVKAGAAGTATVTYQAGNQRDDGGWTKDYIAISVTPAQLKNSNTAYATYT